MRTRSNEPVLHELDDRRVVHWRVRHVMFAREWRNDHVRQPKTQLCCEALLRHGICRVRTWIARYQVAMHRSVRETRIERIRIQRNARNIRRDTQARIRVVIRVVWHWRNVIEWTSAFVVAPEEHRTAPRRTRHKRIQNLRHLRLTI